MPWRYLCDGEGGRHINVIMFTLITAWLWGEIFRLITIFITPCKVGGWLIYQKSRQRKWCQFLFKNICCIPINTMQPQILNTQQDSAVTNVPPNIQPCFYFTSSRHKSDTAFVCVVKSEYLVFDPGFGMRSRSVFLHISLLMCWSSWYTHQKWYDLDLIHLTPLYCTSYFVTNVWPLCHSLS